MMIYFVFIWNHRQLKNFLKIVSSSLGNFRAYQISDVEKEEEKIARL